jgi:lysophospholipase L1-like esterase
MKLLLQTILCTAILTTTAWSKMTDIYKFSFTDAKQPGFRAVASDSEYTPENGFGWLQGADKSVFGVKVPEGNYEVTLTFKSPAAAAAATVKVESRRLVLMPLAPPQTATRKFTVAVLTHHIPGGGSIGIKGSENTSETWNERLTVELFPNAESLVSMEIVPAEKSITVFLAGDSTVTDQGSEPWGAWGQMLPRFFDTGVAVANYAGSGRALFSFKGERRLKKILSTMQPGDYLFIQFGHNDQKDKREGAGPSTTYADGLREYIREARARGGKPVVVSPMERRRWKGGKPGETLTGYANACRDVAAEMKVPFIDLHAMSLQLYGAMGDGGSKKLFVHYPANAFPGYSRELRDNTHHSVYGAYELARCVVEGIRKSVPELASHFRNDFSPFNPSKPDAEDTAAIPRSPRIELQKPEGD